MSDHTERKPLLHEGPLRLLAKNLMDSVKQKDAEIARLKAQLIDILNLKHKGLSNPEQKHEKGAGV